MMIEKFIDFVRNDLWRINLDGISRTKSFFIRQFRIIVLSVRGFDEDKCMLWAASLTFYSLLSIVPVVAMIFGIAKGFGFQERVEQELRASFPSQQEVITNQGQEDVITKIIDFANNLLENTQGGLIAGVGVVLLFWAVIKILGNIENSFNYIWGVKKNRPLGRKFSDYLSFMLVCPVLLVMSSSLTVFVTGWITQITEKIEAISLIAPLLLFLLKFLPYIVVWILFTFAYVFMPNTKVRLSSSLVAGIVAGTVFQLAQWGYVTFQIGAAKYGAIYGSFAALPLFLIWMQISWLIVLFGAEITFAHQNVSTYEFEQECRSVKYSFKMLLSLLVTHLIVKNFCKGDKPSDAAQISRSLDIPVRLVREILFELVEAGILTEIRKETDKGAFYQPGRNVESLTVNYVIKSLENRGSSAVPVIESDQLNKLKKCLTAFDELIDKSQANVPLKEI